LEVEIRRLRVSPIARLPRKMGLVNGKSGLLKNFKGKNLRKSYKFFLNPKRHMSLVSPIYLLLPIDFQAKLIW
jgi:hypothetical protein